ncbi:hypothetical protein QWZ13_09565 [Reinekea marina]|uniref:Uncharacterized protein n=1 Tax=Reinekea marina TaxID=1310421 RepID=A0ABV7WU22_9GAMM|nr:hypothetical protein [Reinekea marina]MBU2862889.1 hypothetical protein [Reinekea forsetii]MDN3649157.1 hypothetical protein [Reinekea marina]
MSIIYRDTIKQYIDIIQASEIQSDPWFKLKTLLESDTIGISTEQYITYFFAPRIVPFLNRIFGGKAAGEFDPDWQEQVNSKEVIEKLGNSNLVQPNKVVNLDIQSEIKLFSLKSMIETYVTEKGYQIGLKKGHYMSIMISIDLIVVISLEGLSTIKNGISTFDVYLLNEPLHKGLVNIRRNYPLAVHLNSVTPFKLHRSPSILFSFNNVDQFKDRITSIFEYVIPSLASLSWYSRFLALSKLN